MGNQLANFGQLTEQIELLVEIQLELDNFTDYNVKSFGELSAHDALLASSKKFVLEHQLIYKVLMYVLNME